MTITEKLQKIHGVESFGECGPFMLEIRCNIGGELPDDVRSALYKSHRLIQDAVMRAHMAEDAAQQQKVAEERGKILALFETPIYVREVPNGYCSEWCCAFRPWFHVTTHRGVIEIGWKKSVIMIDWSESDIKADGLQLFADQGVTKNSLYIHAWGYEKAKEYISQLLAAA